MSTLSLSPNFTRIARRKIEMRIEEGYKVTSSGHDQVVLKREDPEYGDERDCYIKVDPFGVFSYHFQTADLIRDIKLAKSRLDERRSNCYYPEDSLQCVTDYVTTVDLLIEQFETSIPEYGVNI